MMNPAFMRGFITFTAKTHITITTAIWFNLGMDTLMNDHVMFLDETLSTMSTFIRGFVGVSSFMNLSAA